IKICSPTKRRSNMSQKMARVWTQEHEFTLVDGLKKFCANDWKEDNGTFKHGYLMELEQHMNVCHHNCGLQALPHIFFKNKWIDLYAKSMTFKNWPLFVDWEEIFHKDGATEHSAEGT
ncbi:hypothetical protein H5410_063037, partial [Solanum commersonii]